MKNGRKTIKINQKGFSLLEVMIAVVSFAAFMAAFSLTQGNGLNDSLRMREEVILHSLAEGKLNEIIIDPPKFSKAITLSKNTKAFEHEGYEEYEYDIEYRELELPDLEKLIDLGGAEGEEETDNQNKNVKRRLFKKLKTNIEKVIWQVIVTVRNKKTTEEYSLSTWLENTKAKIKVGL